MKIAPFDYQIQDFERFTNDQQFINVVDALIKIETQQGGLTPEEIWEHAIKLLESLKRASRPEITIKRGIMGSVLLITFEVSVLHIVLDSLCTSIGSIVFKCEGKDTNLFSNIQIFNAEK